MGRSGTDSDTDGRRGGREESEDRTTVSGEPGDESRVEETDAATDGTGELRPAVTRHDPTEGERDESTAAGDEKTGYDQDNVAGALARDQPLEPQRIDRENAAFVLLGVTLTVAFLLLAIQGL